jgi:hypothetical protein
LLITNKSRNMPHLYDCVYEDANIEGVYEPSDMASGDLLVAAVDTVSGTCMSTIKLQFQSMFDSDGRDLFKYEIMSKTDDRDGQRQRRTVRELHENNKITFKSSRLFRSPAYTRMGLNGLLRAVCLLVLAGADNNGAVLYSHAINPISTWALRPYAWLKGEAESLSYRAQRSVWEGARRSKATVLKVVKSMLDKQTSSAGFDCEVYIQTTQDNVDRAVRSIRARIQKMDCSRLDRLVPQLMRVPPRRPSSGAQKKKRKKKAKLSALLVKRLTRCRTFFFGGKRSKGSLCAIMWMMMWVLGLVVAAVGACWIAWKARQKRHRQEEKARATRLALDVHSDTILLCLRNVGLDGLDVTRCMTQAALQATSPLRLRFAVVQEDTPHDVYTLFEQQTRGPEFEALDLLGKLRTANVIRSSYLHAVGVWLEMYDGEALVVCASPWNQWAKGWDEKLVALQRGQPFAAALTTPGPQQFCTIGPAPVHQRAWPQVQSRRFMFEGAAPVASLAASLNFWSVRGAHFARLAPPAQQAPRYVAALLLSDWLLASGARLTTVPATLFDRPAIVPDAHLDAQRPAHWDRLLRLSPAFQRYAGLAPAGDNFAISARARLGLTAEAEHTAEAQTKYGSLREMRRHFATFHAAHARWLQREEEARAAEEATATRRRMRRQVDEATAAALEPSGRR